jgi:hypothetical protein
MVGADATITAGPIDLNLQVIHREDERPTFTPGEPSAVTNGGFVEAIVAPASSRIYGFALHTFVECDRPLLDPRTGGPAPVTRFQSVAVGIGYVASRNARVQLEAGHDIETEATRATLGMTLAY